MEGFIELEEVEVQVVGAAAAVSGSRATGFTEDVYSYACYLQREQLDPVNSKASCNQITRIIPLPVVVEANCPTTSSCFIVHVAEVDSRCDVVNRLSNRLASSTALALATSDTK
jgi:hypothetical protein